MGTLSIEDKIILSMDRSQYNTYRCHEHGIYQIKKVIPKEEHLCYYCKKKNKKLTEKQIIELLK